MRVLPGLVAMAPLQSCFIVGWIISYEKGKLGWAMARRGVTGALVSDRLAEVWVCNGEGYRRFGIAEANRMTLVSVPPDVPDLFRRDGPHRSMRFPVILIAEASTALLWVSSHGPDHTLEASQWRPIGEHHDATLRGDLCWGMSTEVVKAIVGDPDAVETLPDGGERWTYEPNAAFQRPEHVWFFDGALVRWK